MRCTGDPSPARSSAASTSWIPLSIIAISAASAPSGPRWPTSSCAARSPATRCSWPPRAATFLSTVRCRAIPPPMSPRRTCGRASCSRMTWWATRTAWRRSIWLTRSPQPEESRPGDPRSLLLAQHREPDRRVGREEFMVRLRAAFEALERPWRRGRSRATAPRRGTATVSPGRLWPAVLADVVALARESAAPDHHPRDPASVNWPCPKRSRAQSAHRQGDGLELEAARRLDVYVMRRRPVQGQLPQSAPGDRRVPAGCLGRSAGRPVLRSTPGIGTALVGEVARARGGERRRRRRRADCWEVQEVVSADRLNVSVACGGGVRVGWAGDTLERELDRVIGVRTSVRP